MYKSPSAWLWKTHAPIIFNVYNHDNWLDQLTTDDVNNNIFIGTKIQITLIQLTAFMFISKLQCLSKFVDIGLHMVSMLD